MTRQIDGLLQPDTRAAHHHLRTFVDDGVLTLTYTFCQFHATIDNTTRVVTNNADFLAISGNLVALGLATMLT